jgi:hypothetical protein
MRRLGGVGACLSLRLAPRPAEGDLVVVALGLGGPRRSAESRRAPRKNRCVRRILRSDSRFASASSTAASTRALRAATSRPRALSVPVRRGPVAESALPSLLAMMHAAMAAWSSSSGQAKASWVASPASIPAPP